MREAWLPGCTPALASPHYISTTGRDYLTYTQGPSPTPLRTVQRMQAKYKQIFIRSMVKRVTEPFELVHSDIRGPFAIPTKVNGYRYFFCLSMTGRKRTCYTTRKLKAAPLPIKPSRERHACGYSVKRFRCGNG